MLDAEVVLLFFKTKTRNFYVQEQEVIDAPVQDVGVINLFYFHFFVLLHNFVRADIFLF